MRRLLLVAHVACGDAFMSRPRSAASVALRAAKVRAKHKGFAAPPAAAPAPTAGPRERWAEDPPDAALEARLDALADASLVDVLNPAVLDGLEDVREKLRAGEVVILRDAFRPDFAEACYRELASRHAGQTLSPHRGQIPTARASCAPQIPSRRSETSVIDRATSAC